MHLDVRNDRRGTVVECRGAIDVDDAPILSDVLRKAFADEPTSVICDLSRVERLNPVCSSIFAAVAAERIWPGSQLVLADGPESVRSVLQATGTTRLVAVHDSVDDAFTAVTQRPPRLREVLLGSADPAAPRRARTFARDVCRRWDLETLVASTTLVVSELVTNVVRHVGGDYELRLEHRAGLLRLAVRDWGPGLPHWPAARPQPLAESGAGLVLVAGLTEYHGTSAHPGGGNVVWAALRTGRHAAESDAAEAVTAERVVDASPRSTWQVVLALQWLPNRPNVTELRLRGEPPHPALPSGEWLLRRHDLTKALDAPTQTSGFWLIPDPETGLVTIRPPSEQPITVPASWLRRFLQQTER